MPTPTCPWNHSCATQQRLPGAGASIGTHASIALRVRVASALLGVILLCAASAVREFDISIRDRHVEGAASTIRVKRGDTVLLRWRSDEAVSLHVHGYDVQIEVSAASTKSTRFEAGVAGRFPITAHGFGAAAERGAGPKGHREVTLLYLEVLPE
jgi:hypothetical protein